MKLSVWVKKSGGVKSVARRFKICEPRIYAWLEGKATPSALMLQELVHNSGGDLTFDSVINDTKKLVKRGRK